MIYQAHPFRFGMKITNVKYLDGIEVCNRNIEHDSHNDIAALWAEKFGLKKTAGSDHHQKEMRDLPELSADVKLLRIKYF